MAHLGFPGGPSFFMPVFVQTNRFPPEGTERKASRTGGQSVTNEQIEIVARLQQSGKGYRAIAAETGLPINSVKSWCRRHPADRTAPSFCQQCGSELKQIPGKRARRFCSDACRMLWWKEHPEDKAQRVSYQHVCRCCGTEFINNRAVASYCSRACFAKARMRVNADG